jgi:hypothetical protein
MGELNFSLDPYLTYVTPVFNAQKYINEILESVRVQISTSGLRYQHILVNDGSTDGTAAILEASVESGHGRVKVVNQANSGEAAAVNAGVSLVKTPFFCVVNADDPLLMGHGSLLTEVLQSAPEVVVAYPDWQMIDGSGGVVRVIRTKKYDIRSLIGDFVCLPGPGAAIRRSAITGELRNVNFKYVSDYESWLRLAAAGPFRRAPGVVATWRQHEGGATFSGTGAAIAEEILRLADRTLVDILPTEIISRFHRSARSHAYYYAALHLNAAGGEGARRLMLKSFLLKPFPSVGYATDHRQPIGVAAVLLGASGAEILRMVSRLRRFIGKTS